jgi:hypothetical protein
MHSSSPLDNVMCNCVAKEQCLQGEESVSSIVRMKVVDVRRYTCPGKVSYMESLPIPACRSTSDNNTLELFDPN